MSVNEFLKMLKNDTYITVYKYWSRYNETNDILVDSRLSTDLLLGNLEINSIQQILDSTVEYFFVTKLLNGMIGLELYINEKQV